MGVVQRSDADNLLLEYSEWLDGQKLVLSEEQSGDPRPHDQLVLDFLEQRPVNERLATQVVS